MFSKLFGGSSRAPKNDKISSRKSKRGESPYQAIHSRKVSDAEGKTAADIVLNEADRQLYRHAMPEAERDFGDLIHEHKSGSMFPYAAIVSKPTEGYDARMRRLVNMQPHMQTRRVDLPDVINVKLFKEVEEFPLTQMFKVSKKGMAADGFDYLSIKRVTFIFAPLSSFVDSHSDVKVSLVDMRKRTDQTARTISLQDNKQYRGEFSLDYCFPKDSIDKISMSFAQEVPTFMVGEQWGACQMFVEIDESTFPSSNVFQETIGMVGLTESMLTTYTHNPAVLNIPVRDSHLSSMREMYLRGDIADETEPMSNKVARASYASSSGVGLKQQKNAQRKIEVGSDGEMDWTAVQEQPKANVPREQNSVNDFIDDEEGVTEKSTVDIEKLKKDYARVQENTRKGLKSAMKKPMNSAEVPVEPVTKPVSAASSASSGTVPIPVGKFADVHFQEGF